ncbi:MAG: hypothetical protein QOG85_2371 [Gaiellaceae bacterium]|jgi:hypothetical protein|nr:hypothetical protein [Gaiellaceae bacterium]
MHTRNALEGLAAAGRPLVAAAESLVDAAEEERLLARIVGTERRAVRHRRPLAVALVGAAVVGAGVAVVVTYDHAAPSPDARGGHGHHVALTGSRIQLAGYRFKTPAGFAASNKNCMTPTDGGDAFAAAAAADGACVEAAFIIGGDWLRAHDLLPETAVAVDVGGSSGYYVPADPSGDTSSLYVALPPEAHVHGVTYVQLIAHGVPEDELIAIAASGLPALPPEVQPVTTTG